MKVLITGAGGQLGRGLIASAPAEADLHPVDIDDCDLTDAAAIAALVRDTAPDLVINAAAYTAVDKAEEDEDTARAINAGAVAALVAARRWRPATPRSVDVTPGAVRLSLRDGRRVTLTPPFRVMLREHWLALHCPRRGWVWVFPDQAGPAALTPLRQVLYLQRR